MLHEKNSFQVSERVYSSVDEHDKSVTFTHLHPKP